MRPVIRNPTRRLLPAGTRSRPAAALLLLPLLLAGAAPPAAARDARDGIPSDGDDVVILADGRAVRCRAGAEAEGRLELRFGPVSVKVPKGSVSEVRLFRDFDPEPRDDEERRKIASGLLRWGGRWVNPAQRDSFLQKDEARARKRWEEDEAHLDWKDRWKRNSDHFAIEANLPKKDLDFFEAAIEGFYDWFTSAFKSAPRRRIPLFLLRTRAEFQEFRKKDVGETGEGVVGYFVPRTGSEHIVLHDWPGHRDDTLSTLFHEATHLFLHMARPNVVLPMVADEGLAEYYGAARYEKGRMIRGRVCDEHLVYLKGLIEGEGLLDLEKVFDHGHRSWGSDKFDVEHYAHAWALVHFFFHGQGGKYLPRFQAWLNAIFDVKLDQAEPGGGREMLAYPGQVEKDLLLRHLKMKDFAQLRQELTEHVKSLPYAGAGAHVARAYRALHAKDPKGAVEALLEAATKGADDPEVVAAAARGLSRLGMPKEASALIERALALDPLDVELRWELSSWLPPGPEETDHVRLCAGIDAGAPAAAAARTWLAVRGLDPEGWVAPEGPARAEAAKARAGLAAGGPGAAAVLRRRADLALRAGDPEGALEDAKALSAASPLDPAGPERAARALAALGRKEEFVAAVRAFRRAAADREAAAGRAAAGTADRETTRLLADAASYALALGRAGEGLAAMDAWFAGTANGAPPDEAGWIAWAGLALRAGKLDVAGKRAEKGLNAIPDAARLDRLVEMAARAPEEEDGK
jgi:tetratricopeptide (TPR) repeat protein